MRIKEYYWIFTVIFAAFVWNGCDDPTTDILSGTDDHTYDSENINIETDNSIDVSMYAQARVFPGLVDTLSEHRVDTTIMLDLSRQYNSPSRLNLAYVPEAIYSTGLYAGAGELITIELNESVQGLSIQIGSHQDDLSNLSAPLRAAKVYSMKALFPGTNTFRNPMGGYIWIRKSSTDIGSMNFPLVIKGAYRAPDFVVDQTDPNKWEQMVLNTTVPWMELRARHLAISVSRTRMENCILNNPLFAEQLNEVLKLWDKYLECTYAFYGLDENSDTWYLRMPDYKERAIFDTQLEDGVDMYNRSNGIMIVNSQEMLNELTNYEILKQAFFDNMNTLFTQRYKASSYVWESEWRNTITLIPRYLYSYALYKEGISSSIHPIFTDNESYAITEQFPLGTIYTESDSIKGFSLDRPVYENVKGDSINWYANAQNLLCLMQIGYADINGKSGWDFYKYANSYKRTTRYSQSKSLYSMLCEWFGVNFAPFFDHWGIAIDDAERIHYNQSPMLDKTIWRYNPLATNPSEDVKTYTPVETDHYMRHDRSEWEIAAKAMFSNNKYQDNYSSAPENLIDNSKSSSWRSNLFDNTKQLPKLPYYIVIDCGEYISADGFYMANGGNTIYRPVHFTVQTSSTDNEIDLSDSDNSLWDISLFDSDASDYRRDKRNEQFLSFAGRQRFRYLRIVFDRPSHVTEGEEDPNLKDVQSFAEFGTYYKN